MLSELLCNIRGIIRVPEGATYTREDVIAVISYAATSTANSVEAAVSELKRKMPDAAIPSADTPGQGVLQPPFDLGALQHGR